MAESSARRFGRRSRDQKLPSERDWERAAVLEPRAAPRHPELVSDGAGLPFALAALELTPAPLDPDDPAVGALLWQLRLQAARTASAPTLDGWRLLASADGEALFALGRPPRLLTVAVRQQGRRKVWECIASSASKPLRATRDGIRASAWRLDPTHEPAGEETTLRVLVTEHAIAAGQRADGRVLAPDLFADEHEVVLTMFVSPRPGFQNGSPNPETPVRVSLPEPIGARRLIDGALALP